MSWTGKNILWAMIFLYIIFFGIFTSLRHYNFQTQAWDMGIFTQTIWNTANGRFMTNAIEGIKLEGIKNHFGVHMSPLLILFAPIYAAIPSPYILLIIQTAALGLGAWPLYLLAKKVLNSGWALLIAGAYLFYPPLHWANNFDFHEITFFIPLFLTAAYFAEAKRWGWMILFLSLAAGAKEDAILVAAIFGFYIFLKAVKTAFSAGKSNPEIKIGLAILLLFIFYFLFSIKVIMPAYGSGISRFEYRYANLGNGTSAIIQNTLLNPLFTAKTIFTPQKFVYLIKVFSPLVFLPLLSWLGIFLLLPGLAENLLTDYPFQFSGFYHYDAILIPGIFVGAIYALKYWQEKRPVIFNKLKYPIISAAALNFLILSPLSPFLFPVEFFQNNPHWEALRKIVKLTPPEVSVAAQTNLIPHLINREQIYLLGTEPFQVDIALIDGGDLSGFADETLFQEYADSYMNTGNYDFITLRDRYFIIYKKGLKLNQ